MRSLLAYYGVMGGGGAGCARDCSGRGDCLNGTCLCEIRYAGDECAGPNLPYHACIGSVFLLVALVCAGQLITCCVSEYRRLKSPSVLRACKVTTQKMLYLLAFLAALIRGAYFVSPDTFEAGWTTTLLSAYYPLLMSGSSLIVCFWAEVFHLRHVRWERPRFLSKSFLGFVTFNSLSYGLLLAEVLVANYADVTDERKNFYQHIFNGCYAVLLLIVVVFFLIYGVEVYFKVRGGFLTQTRVCTIVSTGGGAADASEALVTKVGVQTQEDEGSLASGAVDQSQLKQSRLGLLSQALMLILVVVFLASETLSEFWKTKVAVNSRNWHDVVFRLAEIGVALWYPCVLWNCMAPERLWLLNPRRLLSKQVDDARLSASLRSEKSGEAAETSSLVGSASGGGGGECWICYDNESGEPLIRPCRCSGDVAGAHHSCLSRWLRESGTRADGLSCKVCKTPYHVVSGGAPLSAGWTSAHWARAGSVLVCVCAGAAACACALRLTARAEVRVLCVGGAGLLLLVCCKVLGINMASAMQRAKMSSLKIAEPVASSSGVERELATISSHVTVEVTDKQMLDRALRGEK